MHLTGIETTGLRDLPSFSAHELGRVVGVMGPSPAATALADAIGLAFAALSTNGLQSLLRRWELLGPSEQATIIGSPFPNQASWNSTLATADLVDPDGDRTVLVELSIDPDPPMFGQLRAMAAKEPRLVSGLSEGSGLKLKVGALFASSLDAVAITIHHFSVGKETFPTSGSDRPRWLTTLFHDLGQRFAIHRAPRDLPRAVLQASNSRLQHEAFLSWQAALPDEMGVVRPAIGPGGTPMLLADNRPMRRWGPAATDRASLAASAHLSPAEILWAETEDPWLDTTVAGDCSALEQVWRVHADGALQPVAINPDTPKVSRSPFIDSAPPVKA